MVTQSVRSLSRLLQHILLFSLLVMLAGCSLFGGDDEEEEVDLPADLVKFESTLRIKKAWSRGIGDGTEFLRLALAPVRDGSRVFAAAHDGRVAAFEAAFSRDEAGAPGSGRRSDGTRSEPARSARCSLS